MYGIKLKNLIIYYNMLNTKKKCFLCNKRKKKILLECKCSNFFCVEHLLPEKHNCTFDYKTEGKEKIKVHNPKVINDKIIKI